MTENPDSTSLFFFYSSLVLVVTTSSTVVVGDLPGKLLLARASVSSRKYYNTNIEPLS